MSTPRSTDRTVFVPRHQGPNILPNNSLFSRLLRHAHRRYLAIRDVRLGIDRTYGDLLSDTLSLRQVLLESLDKVHLKDLENGQPVYIGVLAAGGYEFAVAMLAVLAIGAASVPMATGLPVEEATYFVTKSRQVAIISSAAASSLGESITKQINSSKSKGLPIQSINILNSLPPTKISPTQILISADRSLDDNEPGTVIFTSGTTGPPKGTIMRRAYFHDCALAVADHYDVTSHDVILHVLPVHHATGMGISFFPFLLSGACIEFRSGSFDEVWMWERWRKGGLTFFSGVPTIYMRMMRHYERTLTKLPEYERSQYVQSARQFRAMLCGSSALPRPMQEFWTGIRGGKIILTRYGATEFGAVFKVELDPEGTPSGSVGRAVAGIDVKLSEGDEGEILVKSPHMFSNYLYDDKATIAAHDDQGYFRTGDIARREGDFYFIVGRASLDIIKSGGYKISALDIERECLGLPYISEAMVIGVADEEFGQRVGAVVSLRDDQLIYSKTRKLTINDLRRDLRSRLTAYKLPTLLRVVEGELPKGQTGKVLKKLLGPEMFPCPGWEKHRDVQVWLRKEPEVMSRL